MNKHGSSLKIKNGNEMATAIAKIIRDDRRCPKNLQIDMGKEFYNTNVQKLLKKHNININNYFRNEVGSSNGSIVH